MDETDVKTVSPFERDVALGDGSVLSIRPVRPDDRAALQELHDRGLSDTSAYYRFFGIRPQFHREFIDNMTKFDTASRVTLVGVRGDRIVAAGSYNKDSVDAVEVAFAVADEFQGYGIGTLLLEDLAVLAKSAGFTQLVAHALPGNRSMLAVFKHVGLRVRHRLDTGIVDVEMDLHDDAEFARRADEREWAAQAASMRPYLAPRSVVVIGVGDDPASPGHRIAVNAQRAFTGDLAVVRPDGASVAGIPGYRSIRDVPFAVDLAVIAVPAAVAPQVLEECGQAGVHAVVVITSGFSEKGATGTTDSDLVAIAHRSGMRLLGPNCFGVIAPAVGLDATFSSVPVTVGGIAFGSQSGGLGLAVLAEAAERGIGLSSFISLGNRADVSSNDLLCAWVDDPATKVILLYLESIGNPRQFLRIARHVAAKKPVVVLKAGRSTSGRRGAASHTASLASDDAAVGALFEAAGVIRVDTLEEMLDVAQLLAHQGAPAGPRLALVGNSGGPLILAADTAEGAGLQVPKLSDALRARILERVPHAAATSNPVDLLATVKPAQVAEVIAMVAASGEVDAVVVASVGVRPHEDTRLDSALSEQRGESALPLQSAKAAEVPVAISIAGIPARLSKRAVFRYSESAVHAMSRAYAWSGWRARHAAAEAMESDAPDGIDWLAVRRLVRAEAAADEGPDDWLAPDAAERIMRAAGLRLAGSGIATSPQGAADLAERLGEDGQPVVMKAVVPGLLHKTEAGGVLLGVLGGVAAVAAYESFAARFPGLVGVLVQEQVDTGVELLVGARQDPSAGPLVVVAAGGIEAELLADRAIRAAPLSLDEARSMALSLRTSPRLTGFRGRPGVDVDAVARAIARVSSLIALVPELAEFEVNPLVASASGASAVDVRIRANIGANAAVPLRGN